MTSLRKGLITCQRKTSFGVTALLMSYVFFIDKRWQQTMFLNISSSASPNTVQIAKFGGVRRSIFIATLKVLGPILQRG
jgi:hypothetical protein